MRTLELNKTKLWYVEKIGEIEVKDEDGYYTGEIVPEYSEPKSIRLHLYPASGKILQDTFGISTELDFITSTNTKLNRDVLLFDDKPTSSTLDKHNYYIDSVLISLTTYTYGIKSVR